MMNTEVQKFLNYLISVSVKQLNPKKIYLFGSRARNDARKFSDIDLAFEFDALSQISNWSSFCVDMDEFAPIFLNLDLVNLNEVENKFKQNIFRDGKIIYER